MIGWYFCTLLNTRHAPVGSLFFCDVDYKNVYAVFFKVLWRYMVSEYFYQQRGAGDYWTLAVYYSTSHPSYISQYALKSTHLPNFTVSRGDWWSNKIDESIFKIDDFNAQPMTRVDILKKGCEKVREMFVSVYNAYRESRFAVGTCLCFFTRYESRDTYMKRCADNNDVFYSIDTDSLKVRPRTMVAHISAPLGTTRYHIDPASTPKTGWWYAISYYESYRHNFGYNVHRIDGHSYSHVQDNYGLLTYSQDFDEMLESYMSMKFKVGPLKWSTWCIVKTLVHPLSWDPSSFLSFPYLLFYMTVGGLQQTSRYAEEFPTTYVNHPAYKTLSRYVPGKVGEVVKYNPKTDEVEMV